NLMSYRLARRNCLKSCVPSLSVSSGVSLIGSLGQLLFDPAVRDEPDHVYESVQRTSEPRTYKAQRNCHDIDCYGYLALEVCSDPRCECRTFAAQRHQGQTKDEICSPRAKEAHAVHRHWSDR